MTDSAANPFGISQAALDACAQEPIHIPGSIQPQGVLLILTDPELVITQVTINSADVLGREPTQLLGSPLSKLLESGYVEALRRHVIDSEPGVSSALPVVVMHGGVPLSLLALIHRYDGLILLELLPPDGSEIVTPPDGFGWSTNLLPAPLPVAHTEIVEQLTLARKLTGIMAQLQSDRTVRAFSQRIAEQVREITDYDRVMIYKFDAVGNGEVIGEARGDEIEPYLGLFYPASDIPAQARQLYLRNRVRALGNIYYQPVPIVPRINPVTERDPNLSYCTLRSFSPIHLEYLHNMGVRATLVISIIQNGQLWGLIACHHYQPKWPTYTMRLTCDMLAELIAVQLTIKEQFVRARAVARSHEIHHTLVRLIANTGDWVRALLNPEAELLQLVDADGVAVCQRGVIHTLGRTPPTEQIAAITAWLQATQPPVVVTDALGTLHPPFSTFAEHAAGLISMEIARGEGSYVLWFRSERVRTVLWGGNPAEKDNAAFVGERLSPRTSFAAWAKVVSGHARPWISDNFALVESLRISMVDVVLEMLATRHLMVELELMRIRKAVESSSEPIAVADEHETVLFVNDAFVRLFGYDQDALGGQRLLDLLDPADHGAFGELTRLDRSSTWLNQVQVRSASGEFLPIMLRADQVINERGQRLGTIYIYTDLREQMRAEEERRKFEMRLQHTQKLESLGVLAGGIAHDFNNLLTSMLGYASLALMDLPSSSPVGESISQIEVAALRAADLCKQLLAYAGKGRLQIEPVDINTIVHEMVALLQTAVAQRATLSCQLAPNLPLVEGDASQLRQIVMNLVTNAADAVEGRHGQIQIRTDVVLADRSKLNSYIAADDLAEGLYVLLQVRDNGCGMTAETIRRIFDPFFTTKFTGRGLGLAALLGILRSHGGAVSVSSTLDYGTKFNILLPAMAGGEVAVATPIEYVAELGTGYTVLVIDDDDAIRTFSRQVLERVGFTVYDAPDGRTGLNTYRTKRDQIDVVLLDLTMPQMSGLETFQELCQIDPAVRVILCSGYSKEEAMIQFSHVNMTGFVQKPYRLTELFTAIERALGSG